LAGLAEYLPLQQVTLLWLAVVAEVQVMVAVGELEDI
jgi:hypothetical protein